MHDSCYQQVRDLALYHHGNLGEEASTYSCVDKTFDLSSCVGLVPVFGPSPSVDESTPPHPMLSLAVESSLDLSHSTKVKILSPWKLCSHMFVCVHADEQSVSMCE